MINIPHCFVKQIIFNNRTEEYCRDFIRVIFPHLVVFDIYKNSGWTFLQLIVGHVTQTGIIKAFITNLKNHSDYKVVDLHFIYTDSKISKIPLGYYINNYLTKKSHKQIKRRFKNIYVKYKLLGVITLNDTT